MPPGHEPIPSAQTSVPGRGMLVQPGEHDVEEDHALHEDVDLAVTGSPRGGQRVEGVRHQAMVAPAGMPRKVTVRGNARLALSARTGQAAHGWFCARLVA